MQPQVAANTLAAEQAASAMPFSSPARTPRVSPELCISASPYLLRSYSPRQDENPPPECSNAASSGGSRAATAASTALECPTRVMRLRGELMSG